MKCWECRKEISKGLKVQYWEGNSNKECKNIKIRKVCEECHSQLERDAYYDHVLASKSLLIERIIKKRKW